MKPKAATYMSEGLRLTQPEASWAGLLGTTCRTVLRHRPAQRKHCVELKSVTEAVGGRAMGSRPNE